MAQIKQIEVNGVIYDVTGGGGHEIDDSEGVSLTQRDTLQFGEGLLAEDDSVNEKTIVLPDAASAEDISEIVSPLPGGAVRRIKYSTEEQIIGEWIDGKPLYQKTVVIENPSVNWTTMNSYGIANIDMLVSADRRYFVDNNTWQGSEFEYGNDEEYIRSLFLKSSFRLLTKGNGNVVSKVVVTLQYTKTTDTPTT